MISKSLRADGPRDPDEVWDRYVHPHRWPEWSPQIRAIDASDSRIAPGTTGTVHGPGGLRVRFTVIEVNDTGPVRTWSWRVEALGVHMRLDHSVAPHGSGTRTTARIDGSALVVLLYAPIAQFALRRLVR